MTQRKKRTNGDDFKSKLLSTLNLSEEVPDENLIQYILEAIQRSSPVAYNNHVANVLEDIARQLRAAAVEMEVKAKLHNNKVGDRPTTST